MTREEIDELFDYHAASTDSVDAMQLVREAAKDLVYTIEVQVPDCADKSAAIRKIREAVMTANVAIVLNQSKE